MSSCQSQPEVSEAGFSPMDVATAIPKADESSMQTDAKSLPLSVQKTEPPNVEDEKQALKARISTACEIIGAGNSSQELGFDPGNSSQELGFDPDAAKRNYENFLADVAASCNYDPAAMQVSLRQFLEMAEDLFSDPPTAA